MGKHPGDIPVDIAFVGIPFYTLAKYRGMAEAVKALQASWTG